VDERSWDLGVSERQSRSFVAGRVLADLAEEGYIVREKVGRRNRYHVNHEARMRHPTIAQHEIGELLRALQG
jgi:hypothetical protein